MQEGGDVSFLTDEYKALMAADAQPTAGTAAAGGSGRPLDQGASCVAGGNGSCDHALEASIEALKQLCRDHCRFSTGATAGLHRQLPLLDKLLRTDASRQACTLQAAVECMLRAAA